MSYTLNPATGVVTRDSDGLQVAPTQSTDDPLYVAYIDWINAGNAPAIYHNPPPPDYGSKITVLAFRNRFTQNEKIAMEMASIDNPAGTTQQRMLAAMLRATATDLNVATFVDLQRADTAAGVRALEQYGIIGVGRADIILNTPPTETEIPLTSR